MKSTKYLIVFLLYIVCNSNLTAYCEGPEYSLTEMLTTATWFQIFEVEVDSVGYTDQGEFLSRAKILKIHRGEPKSATIFISSQSNSGSRGQKLNVGKQYMLGSGSQDGLNYIYDSGVFSKG